MATQNVLGFCSRTFRRVRRQASPPCVTCSVVSRSAADETIRGGDLVELVVRPDGSASMLVADLSSKGSLSFNHGDTLRQSFRRAALETESPAAILALLNVLRFTGPPHTAGVIFATAFVANIDQSLPRLSYASAGHGPALLVAGRAHRHLLPTGPLLGVMSDASFTERREDFDHDALLVVVTDGFSECRNTALDSMQFGTSGVVRALAFDKVRSCRSAANTVARSADIFTGGRYHDDATVAVIARHTI